MKWQDLDKLHTPCFIFDEDELRTNFADFSRSLSNAWGRNSSVAYSVKTNPFPWILSCARESGCMAEVVSDEEYALALDEGFDPPEIIFNGPIKGREWFFYAIEHGSVVNIDSHREVRWLLGAAKSKPEKKLSIGVRVNIDLEHFCPGETVTGENKGRFGFSYESGEAANVIDSLRTAGVEVAGLHMHVTTRSRSQKVYSVLASHAAKIIEESNLGESLRFVDIGGGFYGGGPKNIGAYDAYAETISTELKTVCDPARVSIYVEPGGAVICTPGYYLGRVVDTKDVLGKRFVVSELSRINIDHEMKKTSYVHELHTAKDNVYASQVLCGYTCMESDRMCVLEDEPELSEGDLILVRYAGAYSMSFTPSMFIEYPPAVYSFKGDEYTLLRAPFDRLPPQ